jgi:hypothetical protein
MPAAISLPIFQVNVPVKMAQAAITTSAVTLYTVPATNRAVIQDIIIANTTAGSLTYTVYLVPAAGTAGTANSIFYQVALAANTSYHWTGSQVLFPGDTIQVLGSATGLTISISGQQVS